MDKAVLIFPVFENYKKLEVAIQSVDINIDIVLVDNSQTIEEHSYPNRSIHYVKTKPHIGFGRACNIGVKKAKDLGFENAIICNQDIKFDNGAISQLIQGLNESSSSILVPMVYTYNGVEIEDYVLSSYGESFRNDYTWHALKDVYQIESTGLCCFAIKLNLLETVPIFDPLYFMYWEDTDFITRCRIQDKPLLLFTRAKVFHDAREKDRGHYRDKSTFRKSKAIYELRWGEKSLVATTFGLTKGAVKYLLKMNFLESTSFLRSIVSIYKNITQIKKYDQNLIRKRIDLHIKKDLEL